MTQDIAKNIGTDIAPNIAQDISDHPFAIKIRKRHQL